MALVLSVTLSVATYQLVRWYLLDKREALAVRQVEVNALVVKGQLSGGQMGPADLLTVLQSTTNARALLRLDNTWYTVVVQFSESAVPRSLLTLVDSGRAGRQRAVVNGAPYIVYGMPIPGRDAAYFEFVSGLEYERSLSVLASVLFVAASITTIGGAAAGWFVSRRMLRPLATVAASAEVISQGDLTHRLDVGEDPDLRTVAASFNDMASSLEARIAREHRFTADVSHELRTPLTAMGAALNLARRSELSERGQYALELLDQQLDQFRRLTLELLEIARIDAGVASLDLTEVDVVELIQGVLTEAGADIAILHSELGAQRTWRLDRTRIERVVANLVENADRYAGGVTGITVSRDDDDLVIVVDDAGPGVPEGERVAIFGRFNRGSTDQPADKPKGTGLGLSLVEEHVHMHRGTITCTASPAGGARFVARIPEAR